MAATLAVAGLTFSTSSRDPAEFTFVNAAEPETLDPAHMTGHPEFRIAIEIFEGLTRRDARTLRPVPGVAHTWVNSDDGLRWTFQLRDDARWSNGKPVTAHDFVYSWLRLLDPKTGAKYAYLLGGLRGAADFDGDTSGGFGIDRGVYALDDRTLVVELEAPIPYFLELTSFFSTFPVPRESVEAHGRGWFLPETIVGNGPFVLQSWRVGDRIRLSPNPEYWDLDAVALRSIDVLAIENPTTALNLYLTGAVDWLPSLYPVELADILRERDDFYSGASMIVYFYRLNTTRPPLDDPRVRRALGLAIDRREITEEVMRLGQLPAHTLVPPGMPGYSAPQSGFGFDVPRAQALLAEAGFPGGAGMREIGILYNTHEDHKKIAEVIADQLRRNLGVHVEAYNQEWQSYLASVDAQDYDIARAGWIGDYMDPNTFLDMFVTDGGNNRTGWSDPAFDALIAAAGNSARAGRAPQALLELAPEPAALLQRLVKLDAAGNPSARRDALAHFRLELLHQAESLLVNRGYPVIPIYFYVSSGLVNPSVEGFYSELEFPDGSSGANLQDLHPLRDVRMRAGAR
ncbi:MAG: peptide ABC transporter substrate-binding protein [Deltaproteobacteria bacterium]|nr:peptide ABC transporter substrate-binding protein [Deltaproteobacteria bacterium]MBW2361879.1 peptide ABC transporter substrate-binding protein [Deltaproteobacteria bacterium]